MVCINTVKGLITLPVAKFSTPSVKKVHITHNYLKVLYYFMFAVFVSFFGAFRVKGLFIDWKSVDLKIIYILPVIFSVILCLCCFAYKYNFVENLADGIVRSGSRKLREIYSYLFLILISVLSSLFSHIVLTGAGAGSISKIIENNSVRVFADIGAGFVTVLLCLVFLSCFLEILKRVEYQRTILTDVLPFLSLVIVSNILAFYYVKSEKVLFYWDNLGYWMIGQNMSDLLFGDINSFIKNVYNSILSNDYNYLPIVPIAVIMKIFGKSRLVYILSILNVYCIPGLWLLRKAVLNICSVVNVKINRNIVYYISVLFFALIYYITFAGLVDAGGLIAIALVILLYFNGEIEPLKKNPVIGLLLGFLYLFRRWYMFWILSFIICMVFDTVIKSFKQSENYKIKKAFQDVAISLIVPLTFGGLLTLFFQPLVVDKLLLSDYSIMYSAYNFGMAKDFSQVPKFFGDIVPVLLILSVAVSIFSKEMRARAIFFAAQLTVCFLLFTRVQTHGSHHYLMYIPGIMILISFLTLNICRIKRKAVSWGLIFLIGITGVLNFVIPFHSMADIEDSVVKAVLNNIFMTQKIVPKKNGDIEEIRKLIAVLDQLSQEGNAKVGVLASSFSLNSDILAYFEMSLGMPEREWKHRSYLVTGPTVDQRSKTPFWLFECDYVLLGEPPLYHLDPKDQKVVTVPTYKILQGHGFGKAFEKMDYSFKLQEGNVIYIYKRVRDVSNEEAQELAEVFHKYYPLLPQQYPPNALQIVSDKSF